MNKSLKNDLWIRGGKSMLRFCATLCAVITFLMSLLHILLVLGVPIGEYVLGGQNKVIPKEKRYIN